MGALHWIVGKLLVGTRLLTWLPRQSLLCTHSLGSLVQWLLTMSLPAQDPLLFRTKPKDLPVGLTSEPRPELTGISLAESVIGADCCPGPEQGCLSLETKQSAPVGVVLETRSAGPSPQPCPLLMPGMYLILQISSAPKPPLHFLWSEPCTKPLPDGEGMANSCLIVRKLSCMGKWPEPMLVL